MRTAHRLNCMVVPAPDGGWANDDPCGGRMSVGASWQPVRLLSSEPDLYRVPLTYSDVERAGFSALEHPDFDIEIRLRSAVGQPEMVIYRQAGRLVETRSGLARGQEEACGVRLSDGAATMTRRDLSVDTQGPGISFTRSYGNVNDDESVLGPGWSVAEFSSAIPLTLGAATFNRVPDWVHQARGYFQLGALLQAPEESWDGLLVNGSTFVKVDGGTWQHEDGRFAQLSEVAAGELPTGVTCSSGSCLMLTREDGVRFYYGVPASPSNESDTPRVSGTRLHLTPSPEPLVAVVDRYGNVTQYLYYSEPDGASFESADACVSGNLAGLPCRIVALGADPRVCAFGYQSRQYASATRNERLSSLTFTDGGEDPTVLRRVAFEYDSAGYLWVASAYEGDRADGDYTQRETYTYTSELNERGPRNLTAFALDEPRSAPTTTTIAYDPGGGGALPQIDSALRESDLVGELRRQALALELGEAGVRLRSGDRRAVVCFCIRWRFTTRRRSRWKQPILGQC